MAIPHNTDGLTGHCFDDSPPDGKETLANCTNKRNTEISISSDALDVAKCLGVTDPEKTSTPCNDEGKRVSHSKFENEKSPSAHFEKVDSNSPPIITK